MIEPWMFIVGLLLTAIIYGFTFYFMGYKKGKKDTELLWDNIMKTNHNIVYRTATAAANKKIKELVKEFSERIDKSYTETAKRLDMEKQNKLIALTDKDVAQEFKRRVDLFLDKDQQKE